MHVMSGLPKWYRSHGTSSSVISEEPEAVAVLAVAVVITSVEAGRCCCSAMFLFCLSEFECSVVMLECQEIDGL